MAAVSAPCRDWLWSPARNGRPHKVRLHRRQFVNRAPLPFYGIVVGSHLAFRVPRSVRHCYVHPDPCLHGFGRVREISPPSAHQHRMYLIRARRPAPRRGVGAHH